MALLRSGSFDNMVGVPAPECGTRRELGEINPLGG
jgi:hypothetical protein